MGFGSLFRLPQHNVFYYKPRYYDPEKERRKEMLNDLRISQGKEPIGLDNKPGASIKGSFGRRMQRKSFSKSNSTIRILVITFALGLLAYIILVADLTPLIKMFMK